MGWGYLCKKSMRLFFLSILLWVTSLSLSAQIPPGYYDPAFGLTGLPLQIALHGIIDNHTSVDYSSLYTYFAITDKRPDNTVWDMYSDIPGSAPPYTFQYVSADECGGYTAEGDCFNREHSWPKSWFGGDVMPMYSDMFHLYPTDGWVNNKRSNYPYGNVGNASWTSLNGSKLGNCNWPGYTGTVFEPRDDFKGDFARSYFYMAVRYYSQDASWPGSDMTTGSQLKPWALAMMLQWSQEDTVSQKEIDRNNAIYQIQHNRNPFIDRPQYAVAIWGPAGIANPQNITFSVYPNPSHNLCHVILPAALVATDCSIVISSLAGFMIATINKSTVTSTLDIGLENISAGAYFLRISLNGRLLPYTAKLIVY